LGLRGSLAFFKEHVRKGKLPKSRVQPPWGPKREDAGAALSACLALKSETCGKHSPQPYFLSAQKTLRLEWEQRERER